MQKVSTCSCRVSALLIAIFITIETYVPKPRETIAQMHKCYKTLFQFLTKKPNMINNILFDDSKNLLFKWTYFVIFVSVLKHNFYLVYEEIFS